MLRRLLSLGYTQGGITAETLPPAETAPVTGRRPNYSLEHVSAVVTAQLVDLDPPVSPAEIGAIHGMVNFIHTDCPVEKEVRFGIVAADGQRTSTMSADPRNQALHSVLSLFKLG